MKLIEEEQLDFDDVSIQPKRSSLNSRSEVDLWRTFKWESSSHVRHELTCRPLMVANMGTVGTPKMSEYMSKRGYLTALEKHYDFNTIENLFSSLESDAKKDKSKDIHFYTDKIAISIGLMESTSILKKLSKTTHKINIINIDCPNGYCPNLISRVKEVRKIFPESFIIAGTVVTGDIVTDLIMQGANCVRVGICAGSVCITAQKTGVRRPIVSMLMDCSDAAHNVKGYIMQDGGIRCPADWCKATVAGADLCMSGSIFAGTDMAEGEIITKRYVTNEISDMTDINHIVLKTVERKFKRYYGMSSNYAQNKFFGGTRKYRTTEGREKLIQYVGSIDDVLQDYEGGMASMMCYIGARKFKDIQRHGTLYKVKHQINTKFENCEDF